MFKKCFVVCPISDEGTETRKRSDQLLRHIIQPICEECEFEPPERVDLIANPNSITEKILDCLRTYDLVIVDLSDHNPNVFYELGYRAALNLPIIQLKSRDDSIPFDVANINTIDYNLSDLDDVAKTKDRLISLVNTFNFNFQKEHEDTSVISQNLPSTILQELYQIKDDIAIIKTQMHSSDATAISVLADKLTANNSKTDEQVIMEAILPKILENPDLFNNLVKLGNNFPTPVKLNQK